MKRLFALAIIIVVLLPSFQFFFGIVRAVYPDDNKPTQVIVNTIEYFSTDIDHWSSQDGSGHWAWLDFYGDGYANCSGTAVLLSENLSSDYWTNNITNFHVASLHDPYGSGSLTINFYFTDGTIQYLTRDDLWSSDIIQYVTKDFTPNKQVYAVGINATDTSSDSYMVESVWLYVMLSRSATEQVINGGFECLNPTYGFGGTAGWSAAVQVSIESSSPYSGTYYCRLYSASAKTNDINKTKSSMTVFGFYAKGSQSNSFGIRYTDNSADSFSMSGWNIPAGWTYIDVYAIMDVSKAVWRLEFVGGSSNPWYIDDVSCILGVVSDTTPPQYTNFASHGRAVNRFASIVADWTDNYGLSGYIFQSNVTTSLVNDTWVEMTGIVNNTAILLNLTTTVGNDVEARIFFNDTSNNWNTTSFVYITVATRDMDFENNDLSDFDYYSSTGNDGYNYWWTPVVGTAYKLNGTYGVNFTINQAGGYPIGCHSYVLYNRAMPSDNFTAEGRFLVNHTSLYYNTLMSVASAMAFQYFSGSWYVVAGGASIYIMDATLDTWYKLKILVDGLNDVVYFSIDDTIYYQYSGAISSTELFVGISCGYTSVFQVWADDIWWTSLEDEPPFASNMGAINTQSGASCKMYAFWTSFTSLAGYIFSSNITGSVSNDTWVSLTGTADWMNVTKVLSGLSYGDRVEWEGYANDSADRWGDTGLQYFIVGLHYCGQYGVEPDTLTGTWAYYANSKIWTEWLGGGTLSGYIFSTRIDAVSWGTPYVNETWVPFSPSGTDCFANFTDYWGYEESDRVFWICYVNDSVNNWASDWGTFILAPYLAKTYDSFEYNAATMETDLTDYAQTGTYAGIPNVGSHGYTPEFFDGTYLPKMNTTYYLTNGTDTVRLGAHALWIDTPQYVFDVFAFVYQAVSFNPLYVRFSFMCSALPAVNAWTKICILTDGLYPATNIPSYPCSVLNDESGFYLVLDHSGNVGVHYYTAYGVPDTVGFLTNIALNKWYDVAIGYYGGHGDGWIAGYHGNTKIFNQTALSNYQEYEGSGYFWLGAGSYYTGVSTDVVLYEDCEAIFDTLPAKFWNYASVNLDSLTIDLEGCGNWVFAEERFYNFNLTASISDPYSNMSILEYLAIRFNVQTENGTTTVILYASKLNFTSNQVVQWGVTFNPSIELVPIKIEIGSRSYDGTMSDNASLVTAMIIHANFRVYFTKQCLDIYLKADCVDVDALAKDTSGIPTSWTSMGTNVFRIYNKGGFSSTYNTSGNAYRLIGGDVFDFYASNGSWVESDMIFHNLQHIKILPRFDYKIWSTFPSFILTYRMDYCLAGDNTSDGNYFETDGQGDKWIRGWGLVVSVNYAITGGTFQFANYTIAFKYNDTFVGDQLVIHAYMDGNIQDGGDVHSRLWFDYWFNRINASSTVGARANAYEYAMRNNGNAWLNWLTGGSWGPYDQLNKEAMLFTDLKDSDGNVISAGKVKMMRFYVKLEVDQDSVHNQTVSVHNYQIFDLTFGRNPFEGIQTPTFEDTIIPTMNRGSLFGTLFSALAFLGGSIWAGFSWIGTWMWNSLTAVFSWLMPYISGAFGSLWNWLLTIPYIGTFLGYVANAFTWMTTMVTQLVGLIVVFFSFFVQIVSGIFQFIQAMVSVFTIMFVTYGAFIPVIVMVVMIELFREGAEEGNWTPLIDTFTMVFGAIMFMIDWGFKIISFVADRIMGGLPI